MIYEKSEFHFGEDWVVPKGKLGYEMRVQGPIALEPGGFILGRTQEVFCVPLGTILMIGGRSTLARQGVGVHVSSCFIDPGFEGSVTLEVFNCGHEEVVLYPGDKAGNVLWFQCGLNIPKYEGKYQGQIDPGVAK